jgi:hypothetical protein
MLKVIATVRRRPGMTATEYRRYLEDVHGGLVRANPLGVARYVQNHVFDSAFGSTDATEYVGVFHRDSVVELFFESADELTRTFSHEYTRNVIGPDGARFAEAATTISFACREKVLRAEASDGPKVIQFLYGPEEKGDALIARWEQAHGAACESAPELAEALTGVAVNVPLSKSELALAEHFGSSASVPAAVVSLSVSSDASLAKFRKYEEALAQNLPLDRRHSFFLYTREAVIVGRGAPNEGS